MRVHTRAFTRETNRQRSEGAQELQTVERALAKTERQIVQLVQAICDGADAQSLNAKLKQLEAEQETRKQSLAAMADDQPLLHPSLATLYAQHVDALTDLLEDSATRQEAFDLIRSLIEEVRVVPVRGTLQIELKGDLASILTIAEKGAAGRKDADRKALQIKMVAGARNQLYLLFRRPPQVQQKIVSR